jgi:hypothetical protein
MIPVFARLTLEVDGERVVVAPWTIEDMAVVNASGFEVLDLFARHIEEPADALERGMLWIGRAVEVWRTEVEVVLERMRAPNRAARRRMH